MKSSQVFRENVKKLMNRRGIKVKDLALMVGLSPSYLSLVLSGERENLSDFHKDAIALALGVNVWELFKEDMGMEEDRPAVSLREPAFRLTHSGVPEGILAVDDFLLALGVEDLALRASLYRRLNSLSGEELAKLGAVFRGTVDDWRKMKGASRKTTAPKGEATPGSGQSTKSHPGGPGEAMLLTLRDDVATVSAALSLVADVPGGVPVDVFVEALRWPVARVVAALEWLESEGRVSLSADQERGITVKIVPHGWWDARRAVSGVRLKEMSASLARAMKDLGREDLSEYVGNLFLTAGELELARDSYRAAWERALEERLWSRGRGFIEIEIALLRLLGGQPWELAYCYAMLAMCCLEAGDLTEARSDQLNALEIWRSLGRKRETIQCLEVLATIEARSGNWERAQSAMREALELADSAEEEARLRCVLGEVLLERGHLTEAKAQLERSLEISRTIDHVQGLQRALLGLGILDTEKGKVEEAKTYLMRVLSLSERGDRKHGLRARLELGRILLLQGTPELALEQFHAARNLCRTMEDPQSLGFLASGEARALALAGRLRELERLLPELERALELFSRTNMVRGIVLTLVAQAEAASAMGHAVKAAEYFANAVRVAQEHGSPALESFACRTYAAFMRKMGDPLHRVMEERANWLRAGLG